jgi:DNA-binding ferritin-like protein
MFVSLLEDSRRFDTGYGYTEGSVCAAERLTEIGEPAKAAMKKSLKEQKLSESTRAQLEKGLKKIEKAGPR